MTTVALETDYLVIGAGAMGMAFIDEVLSQNPTALIVLVDKHAKVGGHWNDSYSFVSLHQPAAFYGVNSEKLGSGGAALASGVEVLSYYERVMAKLLATGRLRYFPMCESLGEGRFASLVEADLEYQVTVRKKTVDATYMNVQVPSICGPQYSVADGMSVVPPNDLPQVRTPPAGYVVIGAGKTGIDAALFLLDQGVDPDHITWISPNDSWFLDREQIQPGRVTEDGLGGQFNDIAESNSLDELLRSLEQSGRLLRLDNEVWPTKYRCATVTIEELEKLRRIANVVRMGRVVAIESDAIVLDEGRIPTDSDVLHVDCTADGLAKREIRPVFEGDRVTLQSLFMCQQVFSAAVIGCIESRFDDDAKMNELCQVVPHPEFSRDFVLAMAVSVKNIENWGRAFGFWLRRSRLSMAHHDPLVKLLLGAFRARKIMPIAAEKMQLIIEQEFGAAGLARAAGTNAAGTHAAEPVSEPEARAG